MNNNFWSRLKKHDKLKLIYVYVFSPLYIMASLGGSITSEIYHKTRQVVVIPCGAIFGSAMINYLPAILPPIAIRFGYFRRSLNYGLELYVSMWVSVTISLLLIPCFTGFSVGTQGFLGTLAVYCILSYGAKGYNDIPNKERYALTFLALAVPFIVYQVFGTPAMPGIFLIYEAIFIAIMVNCHLPEKLAAGSYSSNQSTEPPHKKTQSDTHEDFSNPRQTAAIKLVNTGLAAIGRKTKRTNLYMTPEREAERHRAEYPFLHLLAEKYRDNASRKVLAKHFMLYKETCMFIIFSVVLKNDSELHSLVKSELTERLNDGLTPAGKVKRKEYMYAFSKAFYDEYQRTHNLITALSFSFWNILQAKHTEFADGTAMLELTAKNSLAAVYKYEYDAVRETLSL